MLNLLHAVTVLVGLAAPAPERTVDEAVEIASGKDAADIQIVADSRTAPDAVACTSRNALIELMAAIDRGEGRVARERLAEKCAPLPRLPYAIVDQRDGIALIQLIADRNWAKQRMVFT